MTYSSFWRIISATIVLLATGCQGSPPILVAQEYVGNRVVRYTLAPSSQSSEDAGPLFDLKVIVCDHGAGGRETACTESIVLANVAPGTEAEAR